MVEEARYGTELVWATVGRKAYAAKDVVRDVPVEVAGDEQVELAVIIVIEEACGSRPPAAPNARARRHVSERAVAVVVIQRVVAVAGDVNIRESVVVIIPGGYAHAVVSFASVGEARLLRHISETAVRILTVQAVPVSRSAAGKFRRQFDRIIEAAAVDKENVEQSVVVVVEQGHPAAHRLDQVLLRSGRIAVDKIQPGGTFAQEDHEGCGCRQGPCSQRAEQNAARVASRAACLGGETPVPPHRPLIIGRKLVGPRAGTADAPSNLSSMLDERALAMRTAIAVPSFAR